MVQATFAECFCAQHGVPPERYERMVFRRSLYRRALPFAWFLALSHANYFTADHDLIKAVAHLRSLRDFSKEAENFHQHPYNRGWLRWGLGMRVSTGRLRNIMKASFRHAAELKAAGDSLPV